MSFESDEKDMYGHKKLGGIGDQVSAELKRISPQFNNGRRINTINQRLSYLVRCGNPDAIDSIVPMAFGNIALDLVMEHSFGKMVSLCNGQFDTVEIDVVTSTKKLVDVDKYYNTERLRPKYKSFKDRPLFLVTSD